MSKTRCLVLCGTLAAYRYALLLDEAFPEYDFECYVDEADTIKAPRQFAALKAKVVEHSLERLLFSVGDYTHLILIDPRSKASSKVLPLIFQRLGKMRIAIEHELFPTPRATGKAVSADYEMSCLTSGILNPVGVQNTDAKGVIGVTTGRLEGILPASTLNRFRRSILDLAHSLPTQRFLWRPHPDEFVAQDGYYRYLHRDVARDTISVLELDQANDPLEEFISNIDLLIALPSTAAMLAQDAGFPTLVFADPGVADPKVAMFSDIRVSDTQAMLAGIERARGETASEAKPTPWRPFDTKYFRGLVERDAKSSEIPRENQILAALEINNWVTGNGFD